MATADKTPIFELNHKKWLVEHQKGNHTMVIENAEMNNVVYLYKCMDCTLTVTGKINSIMVDSCKRTSVIFDSLICGIEFINCKSVQMQVVYALSSICVENCEDVKLFLSPNSMDVEIISSKSSEINVMVPEGNGEFKEHHVPEQFKTTVVPNKGLLTEVLQPK